MGCNAFLQRSCIHIFCTSLLYIGSSIYQPAGQCWHFDHLAVPASVDTWLRSNDSMRDYVSRAACVLHAASASEQGKRLESAGMLWDVGSASSRPPPSTLALTYTVSGLARQVSASEQCANWCIQRYIEVSGRWG